MFNLASLFENFSNRKNYEKLRKTLIETSKLVFNGKFIKHGDIDIPFYETSEELDKFCSLLEYENWDQEDIQSIRLGIKIYKNQEIENDIEAFFMCLMLKDLFPEKTELIDFIIKDLETGLKEDNRNKYVDLFDLQSEIANMVLFYMS
jgi:hypothetical protein